MVTPFDDDGALDLPAAVELARWLAAHGSDGLVLSGSTGESSVLTDEEKVALWRAVAEAVTIPVIAGTGSNDTAHSVAMTKQATQCGVDGVLVVTPYYNRPSQAGLYEHFRAVAEAAGDLPVVLYDIPVRAGRRIATPTMLRLARDVPVDRGAQGRGRRPAQHGTSRRAGPAGLRDLQRRRRDDTAPHVGGCGRGHQRRRALDRARSSARSSTPSWPATSPPPSPATPSCSTPSTSSPRRSSPTRCRPRPCCGPWACTWASAVCRWGRPRPELDAQAQKILAAVGPPAASGAPLG